MKKEEEIIKKNMKKKEEMMRRNMKRLRSYL
jgi:hypothetical protein